MARTIEGMLVDPGGRFAIVAGRFNELITTRLIAGAEDAFRRHGIDPDTRLDIIWVPGAFEIPLIAQKVAATGRYASVVTLGAVIRGATAHFEFVAGHAASGVAAASRETGVPIIFGVLTTETIEQAIERAGTKAGNHGYHGATSAIEMASLVQQLEA